MQLTLAQARPYALAFVRPFQTAHQVLHQRKGWTLTLTDEEGRQGTGEAAPLEGFGMETLSDVEQTFTLWAETIPGRVLEWPKAFPVSQTAHAPPHPEPSFLIDSMDLPSGGPAARFALETALLDLLAQRAGLPLAKWLCPTAGNRVSVNATLGADSAEGVVTQAGLRAEEGFKTLKLKLGVFPWEEELEMLKTVRQKVGKGLNLRLDANTAWQGVDIKTRLEQLAPLDIEYLEQPLPPGFETQMAQLAKESPLPLAWDESVQSAAQAQKCLALNPRGVLVLKPMAMGGILATLEVMRMATECGAPAVITTTLDGAYGRSAALHLAAVCNALAQAEPQTGPQIMDQTVTQAMAHGLATGPLLAEDLTDGFPQASGGQMSLSPQSGLGLSPPVFS